MAANLDRAESALTAVSDIAYIRGIDSSGNSVRISKADLASVLGVKKALDFTVSANEEKNVTPLGGNINGGLLFVDIKDNANGACGICFLRRNGNHQMLTPSGLNDYLDFTAKGQDLTLYSGSYGLRINNVGSTSYVLNMMYLPFDL